MQWFHGATRPISEFSCAGGHSDEQDMMFLSASCNVARRYGHHVVSLDVDQEAIPAISIHTWTSGAETPEGTFIITGELDSFDFPVDTLVLRDIPDGEFIALSKEQQRLLDDGRAFKEPTSKKDREWRLFVENLYNGDTKAWLRDCQQAASWGPGP